jgi:glucose dehydrogenase
VFTWIPRSRGDAARRLGATTLLVVWSATSGAQTPPATTVRQHDREEAQRAAARDWPQIGRNYDNHRYSPLTQLTTANVARLVPRVLYQLQMPRPTPGGSDTDRGGYRMYVTTDYDVVTAIDLRTKNSSGDTSRRSAL